MSIVRIPLSNAEIRYDVAIWTGKERTQTKDTKVTAVKNGKTITLTNGTDYVITYENNVNVGQATMIVTGINGYYGTIKRTFNIIPKEPELTSVTASGSSAVVKWTKSETPGMYYKIRYSQNSDFSNSKTVKVEDANAVTKTITDLANGTWYFHILAYRIIDGVEYYSKYSNAKSVNIVPDATTISSLECIEGGIKVTWTKLDHEGYKYQILYSTDSDFASYETVVIKSKDVTTKNITILEPLTKYYIKIRVFENTNGYNYYSKWSEVKSITTGKDTSAAAQQRNAEKIWALGKALGMTDAQCAGILGNMMVESGIDSTSVEGIFSEPYQIGSRKAPLFNGNDITPAMEVYTTQTLFGVYAANGLGINQYAYRFSDGRYCAGLGLIQFTGPLAEALLKYAKQNNKLWYELDLQMAAVIGGSSATRARYQQFMNDKANAGSVYGATASWFGIMEMGAGGALFSGPGFSSRYSYAQQWYNKLSPNSSSIAKKYRSFAESVISIAGL